jgi:predicted HAD superfamily Cof-like phosphohydrolase
MPHSNFQRTAAWLQACGKGKTVSNLSVQIGCDMEETAEFLAAIQLDAGWDRQLLADIVEDLNHLGKSLKAGAIMARIPKDRRAEVLDALCDRDVTGNGVAYLADFDKEEADNAVLDSNDAKLVNGEPVILLGGKIGKPEGWTAPDLSRFV